MRPVFFSLSSRVQGSSMWSKKNIFSGLAHCPSLGIILSFFVSVVERGTKNQTFLITNKCFNHLDIYLAVDGWMESNQIKQYVPNTHTHTTLAFDYVIKSLTLMMMVVQRHDDDNESSKPEVFAYLFVQTNKQTNKNLKIIQTFWPVNILETKN